ncbi:MAG: hemolysin family protein [Microthrixaceae bacterium]
MILVGFGALLLLLAFNAFFVAAEFAIVSVDPNRLRERAGEGDHKAAIAQSLQSSMSRSLTGVQLGITICSLALGVLSEPVMARIIEPVIAGVAGDRVALGLSVGLAIAITAVAQMIVGEIVPKSVAVAKPMETVLATAKVFALFMVVFRPVITFSNAIANALVKMVGLEPAEVLSSVRTRDELRRLLDTSLESGSIDAAEAALLSRTFAFADKFADDSLTPRVAIKALPVTGNVGDLIEMSRETGLSRFPVIGEGLDDIVGVVHIKDVLGIPAAQRSEHPLTELMRGVLVVPESKALDPLMIELQQADGQFAVVADEYGGTAGIITLEDLIEEIVGEISDEHDRFDRVPTVRRWGGAHILSGMLHPDEVAEACGLAIPEGEYETLAGFVLSRFGHIPSVGAGLEFEGWLLEVSEMDGRRIAAMKVVAPSPGTLEIS